MKHVNRPLEPGEELSESSTYIVKRFNGTEDEKVAAELVLVKTVRISEIKKNRDEKKEKNLHNPEIRQETLEDDDEVEEENVKQPSPIKKLHKLYYIHYVGQDRRLDEWVERERFVEFVPDAASTLPKIEGKQENGSKRTLTRAQRKLQEEFHHVQRSYDEMDAVSAQLEKEHEERTKVKHIQNVVMGIYDMKAWYFSPFPEHAQKDVLYVCEFCLAYTPTKERYICHKFHKCDKKCPPGTKIYTSGGISVYEVDGKNHKVYCQCLCLVSKLFMDHKTLYYDVESFLFYVVCEDGEGEYSRIAGHFSKERNSENNLACIMVLPQHQRKGYGKFLIQLSYELSRREGWVGTPERPLSDLGKVSYRSFWWWRILHALEHQLMNVDNVTTRDLAYYAEIEEDDVISTLSTLQLVKGFRGDHVVRFNRRLVDHLKSFGYCAPKLLLVPDRLHWIPKDMRYRIAPSVDSVD